MKKVIKYINQNIIEFRSIRDVIILTAAFYVAWLCVKFAILYLA